MTMSKASCPPAYSDFRDGIASRQDFQEVRLTLRLAERLLFSLLGKRRYTNAKVPWLLDALSWRSDES